MAAHPAHACICITCCLLLITLQLYHSDCLLPSCSTAAAASQPILSSPSSFLHPTLLILLFFLTPFPVVALPLLRFPFLLDTCHLLCLLLLPPACPAICLPAYYLVLLLSLPPLSGGIKFFALKTFSGILAWWENEMTGQAGQGMGVAWWAGGTGTDRTDRQEQDKTNKNSGRLRQGQEAGRHCHACEQNWQAAG